MAASSKTIELTEAAKKAFQDWKDTHKLDLKLPKDTSKGVASFAKSHKNLSILVNGANPTLKDLDFDCLSVPEQDYMWTNIFWL